MDLRIDEQFSFIKEIDKEKNIFRQTYLSDGSRKENDSEHAWHMAIMTMILSEYADEKIDVLKTIKMILIHDIVEIDAGDTYAYDEEGKLTQKEREEKAADRIFGLLPVDQGKELRCLWEEFEECNTPESKFAHAMDNIQPSMLTDAAEGKSWLEHGARLSWMLKRNESTEMGSHELWEYSKNNFILPNVKKGLIIDDTEK